MDRLLTFFFMLNRSQVDVGKGGEMIGKESAESRFWDLVCFD